MASASGKEQFLKQFEAIIAGVKRNKEMVGIFFSLLNNIY